VRNINFRCVHLFYCRDCRSIDPCLVKLRVALDRSRGCVNDDVSYACVVGELICNGDLSASVGGKCDRLGTYDLTLIAEAPQGAGDGLIARIDDGYFRLPGSACDHMGKVERHSVRRPGGQQGRGKEQGRKNQSLRDRSHFSPLIRGMSLSRPVSPVSTS
jgi:hypothetical protein